jgi:hypothetical protein
MFNRPNEIEYFADLTRLVMRIEFLQDREIKFKVYKPGHIETTFREIIQSAMPRGSSFA